jgi:hypothetical protein
MATVVEFESLSEALSDKKINLETDTIKAYFTNTAPSASADAVLADLPAETANGNGYTTGGLTAACSTTRTNGQTAFTLDSDLVLTATGVVADFRYIAFYSDTSTNKDLIGYIDHGVTVSMVNTNTYTITAGTILTIN